ncbi:MAG: hypothetical protein AAF289_05920 [Cyanobacteria bacterium P01_A01_bin.135]
MAASEFAVVTSARAAALSEATIAYSTTNGALYYNPNGAGAGFGAGEKIATVEGSPMLSADSFAIQA